MTALNMATEVLGEQVSSEGWEQRIDLGACYRLIAQFGRDDPIYTHTSNRLVENRYTY